MSSKHAKQRLRTGIGSPDTDSERQPCLGFKVGDCISVDPCLPASPTAVQETLRRCPSFYPIAKPPLHSGRSAPLRFIHQLIQRNRRPPRPPGLIPARLAPPPHARRHPCILFADPRSSRRSNGLCSRESRRIACGNDLVTPHGPRVGRNLAPCLPEVSIPRYSFSRIERGKTACIYACTSSAQSGPSTSRVLSRKA